MSNELKAPEERNYETLESFEFDIDADGNFNPSSMTELNTDGSEKPKDVDSNSVETSFAETGVEAESGSKRVPTESVELDIEQLEGLAPQQESSEVETNEDTEFKFDDGVEPQAEPEAKVEGEEGGEPEYTERELELLKRVEALEKQNQNELDMSKYSKDKTVMPNISEYDYASLGKELAENGSLSEESYNALAEKGYSKEVVDNHIQQTLAQANAEIQANQPETVTEAQIKDNYAKELNMDVQGLDNLLADVKNVFTPEQAQRFDDMNPQEQIITLQKFQLQKMQHEQNVNSKRLVKGNHTKVPTKDPLANMSVEQISAEFNKAINSGNANAIDYWGNALEKKGAAMIL